MPTDPDRENERFLHEERAAIIEYLGNHPRKVAEIMAYQQRKREWNALQSGEIPTRRGAPSKSNASTQSLILDVK